MTAKKSVRSSAKKSTKKVAAKKVASVGSGGYRAGTMKEQIHKLFVKYDGDIQKAKAAALKINPNVSTVNNWFSQFRTS